MPCDLNELKAAATCFMTKCMGDSTRESIDLYVALAYLAAKGGTDYTNNLSALEVDANQWERLAPSDRAAILTYINLQFAIDSGADFGDQPISVGHLKSLSACIQCLGSEQRKSLMAFVWCQILGVSCGPIDGFGSPVDVVTPQCVGQIYTDLTSNDRYIAHGRKSSDWVLDEVVIVIGGEGGDIIGGEGGGMIEVEN